MPPSDPTGFDPLAPAVLECPYAHWAALRSEAPVVEVADGGYWLALETLLARTRSIQLAEGASVRHLPSVCVRRLAALEIALTR